MIKTARDYKVRNGLEQRPFSTPFPPDLASASFYLSTTKWKDNGEEKIFLLGNRNFHNNLIERAQQGKTFIPLTSKHRRRRREIDAREITMDTTECANNTFTISYEDDYKVWNSFSITYQSREYIYYQYRVTDKGLQVCNSDDFAVQEKWWYLMEAEKINLASKLCNVSVDSFYRSNYTLFKNFTVFFKSTLQSFTRKDYGVTRGYFSICSGKLSLSCNDYLVKVKYREQYKVFKNFSLSYHKKHYDYREYRLRDDTFELCTSNDSRVQDIWKTQNSWEKDWYKHYPCWYYIIKNFAYVVGKHFSVFFC